MHTRSRRKPRQNTLLFEELEPRLLFSADAAEALTGMAVEQSVDEEPEVAAAEEPAADSVDQSTAADTPEPMAQPATQDQPGETADAEAAPQLLESEAPAEAAPADAEPAATGEPVLPADADIDPAQPVAESTAQPTTADTPDPVAQAVVDGDQAAAAQELAPTLVEPVETSESATLIDSTAAADEPSATTASIEPTAGLDQPTPASELVFIDGAVRDGQTLVDSLLAPREDGRSFEVVVLDPDRVGIDQVSTALAGYDNLQAIHFLSHGGDGELLLGSTRLDSTSLPLYTDALTTWGDALADSGDILLYGCDIAASADGQFLVDHISQLTGADVAASTDATGLAALGGDWELEYLVGTVEATTPIDPQTQQEWSQVLAAITTGTSSSAGTGTNTTATSLTWSHTIGSGSNSILLVNVAMYDDKAAVQVNSVTYGGTALTRLGSVAGARTRAEMWYLKAPASGTANIVVTTTASVNFTAGATTFFNVDQTSPFRTPVTGSGSGNPSLLVASAPGELVVDVIADRDIDATGSVTTGANQTPLWVQWNGNDLADATGASSREAGAASVTMSWATTGGGAGEWAAVAVSLKPVVNSPPLIVSDGGGSTVSLTVVENTTAVTTVTATDVDGDTLTYSIAGGADATSTLVSYEPTFSELSDTGYEIKVGSAWGQSFRYNSGTGSYQVNEVGLVLSKSISATAGQITVTVRNAWNGTVLGSGTISTAGLSTSEAWYSIAVGNVTLTDNTQYVIQVATSTADKVYLGVDDGSSTYTGGNLIDAGNPVNGKDVAFRLEQSRFTLNSTTGELRFITPPDIETPGDANGDNIYEVIVQVSDGFGGIDTQTINAKVIAAPVLILPGGPASYIENSPGVVIDATATVSDADSADFAGGLLTVDLTANGTANDRLSVRHQGTAAGQIGVAGDSITYGGVEIGTGSGGTGTTPLVITLTSAATPEAVQALVRNLTFHTDTDNPDTATRTVRFVVSDGDGATSAAVTQSVTVLAQNDAPVLDTAGSMTLSTITEDQTTNTGNTVAEIIASGGGDRITDPDAAALEGIAVTGATVTTGNGTWQYSLDNGTTWASVGAVADTSALLLRAEDRVRFLPDAMNGAEGTLAFRAWDQSTGSAGSTVDVSTTGGSTAFSTATETASITVTAVNDAPGPPGASVFMALSEDTTNPWGKPVADFTATMTDADAGALKGIAVTEATGSNGIWQYTLDNGSSWQPMGEVSVSSARLLPADGNTVRVRFVPNPDFNGYVYFGYYGWDQTQGTVGALYDASVRGGTTAFSSSGSTVSQNVTALNDAPTALIASVSLTPVGEDTANPAGDTVASLLGASFSDARDQVTGGSSANSFAGVAVVANAATSAGEGAWQWYNGTSWTDIGTSVSTSSALALAPDTLVRFLPAANYYGTPGALTVRLIDNSAGAVTSGSTLNIGAGGATTAYSDSSNAVTLSTSITPVNDAPVGLPVITGSVVEDQTLTADTSGLSDVDGLGALSYQWLRGGVAITGATAATYTLGDSDVGATIAVAVSYTDGGGTAEAVTSAAVGPVANVNDAPVVTIVTTPVLFKTDPIFIDPTLTVTDIDNATLVSAQVSFGKGFQKSHDLLEFTDQAGITGSYDTKTGTLTLTGTATVADYQAALRSVIYRDINPTPAEGLLYVHITVSDGVDTSIERTQVVEVVSNLPPRAGDDAATVAEGSAVLIDLAANDTDDENKLDLTSLVITSGPVNGSVSIHSDGTVTYTHDGSETTSDTFAYTIKDKTGKVSSPAPVSITVVPVNDLPTAANNTVTTSEDSPYTFTAADFNFSDNDGDTLASVRITSLESAGSLLLAGADVTLNQAITRADIDAGQLTYAPLANGNGTAYDSFGFSVNDGTADSAASYTMTIDVTPVNDLTAQDDSFTVNEDATLSATVATNDTTTSGGTLTYAVASGVSSGSLSLNSDGSFTYTPNSNFNGDDSFTYTVTDAASGESDTRTVSLTIDSVDDAVTIGGDTSGTGNEDTVISGTLTASDTADGLTDGTYFTVSTDGTNGSATIDPATGLWTYTPNADFNGSDTFTVTITDDDGHTATQLISIGVTAVADIVDDGLSTNEDTAISANVLTGTNGASADNFEGTPVLTSVTQGTNGSVTFDGAGNVTYTPDADFNGTNSFTYTVTSGGVTETATVTVTVNKVDDPATIGGDTSGTGDEDTVISGALTATDTADGLTDGTYFTVTGAASDGTATIDAETGAWSYTPNADFNGSDTFTVTITDDDGHTATQLISIGVTAVADIVDDGLSTNEDTAISANVLTGTNGASADNFEGTPVLTSVTQGTNGSVTFDGAGNVTYTPDADFNGTNSFTYTVTSGGVTETATVTVTVNKVDDPVTIGGDTSGAGDEDTVISGALTATDTADGLTDGTYFTVTGAASDGTATIDAETGAWSYTPNADFNGSDTFTVTITDDDGHTATQLISITVNPVTDIVDDSLTTVEDTAVTANVLTGTNGASADNFEGTPVLTSVTQGTNGSVTFDGAGNVTYTPNANFNGTNSFTYTVTSGGVTETATVTVTVNKVDDPVTIGGDTSGAGDEDTVISGALTATDTADGLTDGTYFTVTGAASDGTATIDAETGAWSYTPNADFNGSDTFTVTITDDDGHTATQLISITVNPVTDIVDDSLTTVEDTAVTANVLTGTNGASADNFEGTPVLTSVTQGTNGSVTFDGAGNVTYTPNANFNGTDAFTYTVTSGGVTETATVTVTVNPITDLTAQDDSFTLNEDTILNDTVATNDSTTSGGTLTYAVASGVSSGSLNLNSDGSFTYTPTANFNGSDSFTYTVTDAASGESATQTVSITVIPVADLTGTDDSFTTSEDTLLNGNVSLNDSTTSGGSLSYALASGVSSGSLSLNSDGSFTYTPNSNFNGGDSFTYTVTDAASGESSTQTVSITVTPVADLTGTDDSFTTSEDTLLSGNVSLNDSTTSGGALSYAVASGVSSGSLSLNSDGSFTYTPNSNFNGADSFTYTVTDAASGESATRTVAITVTQVNDAPVATNDAISTSEDAPLIIDAVNGLLANDSDIDADALTAVLVAGPAHGTLTLNADGSFTYTPDADWHGNDTFTYTANDGTAASAIATVTLTVAPVNDAPTLTSPLGNQTGIENEPLSFTVAKETFADVDAGDVLTYSASGLPAWLRFDPATRTFSGTPAEGDAGRATITLRATDTAGAFAEDSFDLVVANSPAAPLPPEPPPSVEPVTPPSPVVDDGENVLVEPPASIPQVEQPGTVEPVGPTVLQPDDPLLHPQELSPTVAASFDPLQPADTDNLSATEQEPETEQSTATLRLVPDLAFDQALVANLGPTQGVPATVALQVDAAPADNADSRRKEDPNYLTPSIQLAPPATLEFTMPVLPAAAAEYFHLEDLQAEAPYAANTASEIDAVLRQMDQSAATRGETEQFITYVASGLSLSLTAGFASYLLRAGSLLSSLLATVPIWRNMDPLAILVSPKKKKSGKGPDDPSASEPTPDEQVENLFADRERP